MLRALTLKPYAVADTTPFVKTVDFLLDIPLVFHVESRASNTRIYYICR